MSIVKVQDKMAPKYFKILNIISGYLEVNRKVDSQESLKDFLKASGQRGNINVLLSILNREGFLYRENGFVRWDVKRPPKIEMARRIVKEMREIQGERNRIAREDAKNSVATPWYEPLGFPLQEDSEFKAEADKEPEKLLIEMVGNSKVTGSMQQERLDRQRRNTESKRRSRAKKLMIEPVKKQGVTRGELITVILSIFFLPFFWVLWTRLFAEALAWGIPEVASSDILSMPIYWVCTGLLTLASMAGVMAFKAK